MESQTSAAPMPDVKATTCDLLAAGSPAASGIHLEGCMNKLPASLSVLGSPSSSFADCNAVTYGGLREAPSHSAIMPGCHSGSLLTNLGLRYCSTSSVHPLRQANAQPGMADSCLPQVCVSTSGRRHYRSMENLHWAAVSEPSFYAFGNPYRSVDSEFIFRCTATSHWYDDSSGAFYPVRVPVKKDLPLLPQWLFPTMDERVINGDTRRGLKEKLRHQSARVTQPNKPLRPPVELGNPASLWVSTGHCLEGRKKPLSACRITSPEEIKQEAMRRLELRRQSSTPNLTLLSAQEPGGVFKSRTAESLSMSAHSRRSPDSSLERKRPPMGRLHIPTFEEFKRMRQKEGSQVMSVQSPGSLVEGLAAFEADDRPKNDDFHPTEGESRDLEGLHSAQTEDTGGAGMSGIEGRSEEHSDSQSKSSGQRLEPSVCQGESADGTAAPICTGPTPRSALQPLTTSQEGVLDDPAKTTTDSSDHAFLPVRESSDAPSSCCPALLLDSTDLSNYGAKISKIKDGFIGSALDLIKKSCTAEIAAEAPIRLSRDQHRADITSPQLGRQSSVVSMTMPACSTEPQRKGGPSKCQSSGPGCRRASSDAAYRPNKSVRTQREGRLRPHFSDPMPADAAKRKQLVMKIAAAARLHTLRRGKDECRDSPPRDCSEINMGATAMGLGVAPETQQRWSDVSSLSADSGVVGLSDEREEDEEMPKSRQRAEVERVDSGIGPGLSRSWKRPPVFLQTQDAQWSCPDCGHRDFPKGNSMCAKCLKQCTERKEAILEFLNTESSYGEDLRIIKEEFYCPMQSAGLLTAEQLVVVFSNVQELIDVNGKFTESLQESIDRAFDQGDEDLLTVSIGEIFLDFANMLPAFQTYCLQQSTSVNMLNTLEKEKELLRIFLDVSQNDNTALRRMNLRSFLMAPLQRVTKYPLLLSRISKATAESHPDHARLREAKSRVESHLEHINMKTKQECATWTLRSFRRDSRKNREVINIEMREVSMKTVGWARESTRFVMEGPLQLSQPADGQWVKKGSKALKFQNVHSLLMVHMQRAAEATPEGSLMGRESQDPVQDGVLVLIKDKSSGKFTVLREPIRLCNCVVSADPVCEDTFELLDIPREAFVFRAADRSRTQQWFHQIKRYSRDLGLWRRRRNALPNIMINTAQNRS